MSKPRKSPAPHIKLARWVLSQIPARFVVYVKWEGKTAIHQAANKAEALEWLECYPEDARTLVRYYPLMSAPVTVTF